MEILYRDMVSMDDSQITEDEIRQVVCIVCKGEAYQVVGTLIEKLPVKFSMCTECGALGVISLDSTVSPISEDYDRDLRWLYGRTYASIRKLQTLAVQRIMASKAHLN